MFTITGNKKFHSFVLEAKEFVIYMLMYFVSESKII